MGIDILGILSVHRPFVFETPSPIPTEIWFMSAQTFTWSMAQQQFTWSMVQR